MANSLHQFLAKHNIPQVGQTSLLIRFGSLWLCLIHKLNKTLKEKIYDYMETSEHNAGLILFDQALYKLKSLSHYICNFLIFIYIYYKKPFFGKRTNLESLKLYSYHQSYGNKVYILLNKFFMSCSK
jgi:hypothetical protein